MCRHPTLGDNSPMKTDTLFYEIFQTQPELLLELLGHDPAVIVHYDFRSVELKQTAFRIDGLLIPKRNAPNAPVYFSEVQFQKDPQLYHRFFAEIYTYLKQYPETPDWQGILIFPKRSLIPPEQYWHLYRSQFQGGQVTCIYLEDLADRQDLPVGLAIIYLVVESKRRAKELAKQIVQRVKQEVIPPLEQQRRLELIETILVYKFGSLTTKELEAMFGLSELKKTRVFQEGREEGREKGREEAIVALLERRFGTVDEALQATVPSLAAQSLPEALAIILERSREEIIDRFLP
jgi:predicted transposase/invertase (TIGR01784 family)